MSASGQTPAEGKLLHKRRLSLPDFGLMESPSLIPRQNSCCGLQTWMFRTRSGQTSSEGKLLLQLTGFWVDGVAVHHLARAAACRADSLASAMDPSHSLTHTPPQAFLERRGTRWGGAWHCFEGKSLLRCSRRRWYKFFSTKSFSYKETRNKIKFQT